MSLISVRNFIAPFSNKIGIGALVVVTIIVAVARISGAHSNRTSQSVDDDFDAPLHSAESNHAVSKFLNNQPDFDDPRAGLRAGANSDTALVEDPVLADLLTKELTVQPKAQPKAAQEKGLSDIKRTLGLE